MSQRSPSSHPQWPPLSTLWSPNGHIYMLPGKVCGDVIQSEGEKWKIEERKKR